MTHEEQYIKETGDKKPEPANYHGLAVYNIRLDLSAWQDRFITWLFARLEKQESELEVIRKLIDKGEIKILQDFHGNLRAWEPCSTKLNNQE